MKYLSLLLAAMLSVCGTSAQNLSDVDAQVAKMGSMDSLNVAQIADSVTRHFAGRGQKARAIFYWIANNISPDLRATKSNDNRKIEPEMVIASRQATPLGYAMLVQEMCSRANIRCLTVDGFIKRNADDINNPADEINHAWNVVQLGQSPDDWYYVDAFKAAGSTDKRYTRFIKNYTPAYFFADQEAFNLQNFPDNLAWKLGGGAKSVKEFYKQPVVHASGMALGISKLDPATGVIKTKLKNPVTFTITCKSSAHADAIHIVTGDDRKPDTPIAVRFSNNGGTITFEHKFRRDDEYPVRIVVDGNIVAEYFAIVTE